MPLNLQNCNLNFFLYKVPNLRHFIIIMEKLEDVKGFRS